MLAMAAGEITWATIAGILAMVCLAISPLFKHRTGVLLAQLGTSAGYGVHYALCDLMTAAASCGLSAVQILLAIPLATRPSFKPLFYLFMPVLIVAATLTWQGPVSAAAVAAMAFTTLARMQERPASLRLFMLGAQIAWLVHDVAVWSLPAIAGDVASLVTGATMVACAATKAVPRSKLLDAPDPSGSLQLAKEH
jgi:hypothetical protein